MLAEEGTPTFPEDIYILEVDYEAGDGEANRLSVEIRGNEVVFEDLGAEIEARGECTRRTPNRVACSSRGDELSDVRITLDEGDDRVEADDPEAHGLDRVRGGKGNDVLLGGPADSEEFFGDRGDDQVDSGPGGDEMTGGGGRDELRASKAGRPFEFEQIMDGESDAGADADLFVGNGVLTLVTYASRKLPVEVDLRAGIGGATGEEDRLVGITHLTGGDGDDVLLGTDGDDGYIRGGRGADGIRGRAGDDRLSGQRGDDHVFGGRGDDTVDDDAHGGHDVQRCGRGTADFVTSANTRDRLRKSCEDGPWATERHASFDSTNRITATPRVGRKRVEFQSTCHSHPRCNGRIKLKNPNHGKLLGRGEFSLDGSFRDSDEAKRHKIVAKLNKRGRKRTRRGAWGRVVFIAHESCGGCPNPDPNARTGFTTRMSR